MTVVLGGMTHGRINWIGIDGGEIGGMRGIRSIHLHVGDGQDMDGHTKWISDRDKGLRPDGLWPRTPRTLDGGDAGAGLQWEYQARTNS